MGGEDISVLPVPIPAPPSVGDVGDGGMALDRMGDDRPLDINIRSDAEEAAVEFRVEAIDEIQVEEVHLEDVETGSLELAEPIVERGEVSIEEEDVDDLDG